MGFSTTVRWLWPLLLIAVTVLPRLAMADDAAAWTALRQGGAVLILRHALAPGVGDPDHFDVNDCSTQRNLNNVGQEQARAWGRYLAEQGIRSAQVFSSAWCRCRDTATLMDVGRVTVMPSLNSFFAGQGDREAQTAETVDNVNGLPSGQPIILVSHQVNITALTGVYPDSGEGLILAMPLGEDNQVLARVGPDRAPD